MGARVHLWSLVCGVQGMGDGAFNLVCQNHMAERMSRRRTGVLVVPRCGLSWCGLLSPAPMPTGVVGGAALGILGCTLAWPTGTSITTPAFGLCGLEAPSGRNVCWGWRKSDCTRGGVWGAASALIKLGLLPARLPLICPAAAVAFGAARMRAGVCATCTLVPIHLTLGRGP